MKNLEFDAFLKRRAAAQAAGEQQTPGLVVMPEFAEAILGIARRSGTDATMVLNHLIKIGLDFAGLVGAGNFVVAAVTAAAGSGASVEDAVAGLPDGAKAEEPGLPAEDFLKSLKDDDDK